MQKRLLFAVFLLVSLFLVSSCSDEDPAQPADPGDQPEPLVLAENLEIINENQLQLISNETELATGILVFESATDLPEIGPGDIVVGRAEGGYLRRVTESSVEADRLTLHTSSAHLTDAIVSGDFTIDVAETTAEKFSHSLPIPARTLVSTEFGSIGLAGGQLSFDFSVEIDGTIHEGVVTAFSAVVSAHADCAFDVTTTIASGFSTAGETTLYETSRLFEVQAGGLPVVGRISFDLLARWSASLDASVSWMHGVSVETDIRAGGHYDAGDWTGEFTSNLVADATTTSSVQANARLRVELVPRVSVMLYGVIGPVIEAIPYGELESHFADGNLDTELRGGIDARAEIAGLIVDEQMSDWSYRFDGPHREVWHGPDRIERLSDARTIGSTGQALASPLSVRVLDSEGAAMEGALVRFAITDGSGALQYKQRETDAAGEVATNWTLGPELRQGISVRLLDHSGADIAGSPISFEAVNDQLDLNLVSPEPNSQFEEGESIEFRATATDDAGRDIGTQMRWSWRTGTGDEIGTTSAFNRPLSPGNYAVTVQATLADEESISLSRQVVFVVDGEPDPLTEGFWYLEFDTDGTAGTSRRQVDFRSGGTAYMSNCSSTSWFYWGTWNYNPDTQALGITPEVMEGNEQWTGTWDEDSSIEGTWYSQAQCEGGPCNSAGSFTMSRTMPSDCN